MIVVMARMRLMHYVIRKEHQGKKIGKLIIVHDIDNIIISLYMNRCDFEYNICGFSREANSDFQWQLVTGGVMLSSSTSPAIDHTTHLPEGQYLFADPMTSNDYEHNGKARIGTPGMLTTLRISVSHQAVLQFAVISVLGFGVLPYLCQKY